MHLPTLHAGLAIPNPSSQASKNYNNSTVQITHLIGALGDKVDFDLTEHK